MAGRAVIQVLVCACDVTGSSKARRLWKGPSSASGFSLGAGAQELLADVELPAAAGAAAEPDGAASDAETVAAEDMDAIEDLLESAAAMAAAQDPVSTLSRCAPAWRPV